MFKVELTDVKKAQKLLEKLFPATPLVYNGWLSEKYQCKVFLKLENMQPIGSFKIRGATYKISRLGPSERKKGVIAASAGNHAQGVAWGSRQLGIRSTIVMPECAPLVKIQNTQALGAEVILRGKNYDQAFAAAQILRKKTGKVFVHAFDDQEVIAGQGTLGLELRKQLPKVDYIFGSVGGGGMMGGVGTVFRELSPKTRLVGCQAEESPSVMRSVQAGQMVSIKRGQTFADGIAVQRPSVNVLELLSGTIHEWAGVSEEEIANGVLTLLEKARVLSEGAGAVPLAALEQYKEKIKGKTIVLIVSGGNLDVNVLSRIIDLGLIRAGRRLRANVLIEDRPGSLAQLTRVIAAHGANILQAIHDRSEPYTKMNETEVALTLETRGPKHSRAIIDALKENFLRVDVITTGKKRVCE